MIGEFAMIVGLLSAFSSGRKAEEHADMIEFLTWLTKHNHDEIREAIEGNNDIAVSIKGLLNRGFGDIHKKLDDISNRIAILASRSEGIEGLAISYADVSLSDQALEILSLMEENESKYFLLSSEMGSNKQRLILSPGPNYLCEDTRFFQDDLALMLDLKLLIQDYNKSGDPMFYFTRAASRLIGNIK